MITSTQINTVVNQIKASYQPEKIILFGSYAQDNATEKSDLDLLLIKQTDAPRYKRCSMVWSYLAKNKYPFPIDIIVYTPNEIEQEKDNKYSFIYEVLQTGKTVYEQGIRN